MTTTQPGIPSCSICLETFTSRHTIVILTCCPQNNVCKDCIDNYHASMIANLGKKELNFQCHLCWQKLSKNTGFQRKGFYLVNHMAMKMIEIYEAAKRGPQSAADKDAEDDTPAAKKFNPDVEKVEVGTCVEVFWPDDNTYYKALVKHKRTSPDNKVFLQYEIDNECEWLDLNGEKFRILDEGRDAFERDGDDSEEDMSEVRRSDDEATVITSLADVIHYNWVRRNFERDGDVSEEKAREVPESR